MKLKLDENLNSDCANLFRKAGLDATTVAEQGLCSAPDTSVIEHSRSEDRCLVTLDKDFGNPLLFRPSLYPGIALLRLPARPTPEDLADATRTLISELSRQSIRGKLWVVQRGRIRIHQEEP